MATSGSAGYDLLAAEDRVIDPHSPGHVCLYFEMQISLRYYGRNLPRSSLAR